MISLLGYLKRTDVAVKSRDINKKDDVADDGGENAVAEPQSSLTTTAASWEWKGLWSFDVLTEGHLKETSEGGGSSNNTPSTNRNGKQIQRPRSNSMAKYNQPQAFHYRFDKAQDANTVRAPRAGVESTDSATTTTTTTTTDNAAAKTGDKNDGDGDKGDNGDPSTAHKRNKPETFGSNGFTDAGKDQSSGCPLGGSWNGYFENVIKRKDRNPARVSETFSLFFNATPAPDVTVSFTVDVRGEENKDKDESSSLLPKNHVHVRGMGSNQFGTFELKGSYDPSTSVLRCYRMYIIVPPPPSLTSCLKRKSSLGSVGEDSFASGRTPTRVITRVRSRSMRFDDMEDPNNVSLMNASSSSSKKHYTRKKRMSWQKEESRDIDSGEKHTGGGSSAASAGNASSASKVKSTSQGDCGASGKVKPSRKRSRSMSAVESTSSASKSSKSGAAAASSTSSQKQQRPRQTSPLTLPKAGLENDARWRAAHYFQYQPATDDDPPAYVVYEGELLNQQRHGMGVCLFPNNTIYEGSFRKNREHGRGTLMSGDRSVVIYQGDWERGRMHGRGTLKEEGGAVYTGDFKENAKHGVGRYDRLESGLSYDGEWRENVPSGRGVFTWPDGSTFVGHWKNGKRHGQGMLKVSDGFEYDGMWNNNAMEGRGIAIYPNGQRYEGLWSKGKKEGRGTVRFTNGAIYEGRFKEDRMEGQGTMKMVRNVVIENKKRKNKDGEEKGCDVGEGDEVERDWMIPIQFQSDMRHIHQRAGFTQVGE